MGPIKGWLPYTRMLCDLRASSVCACGVRACVTFSQLLAVAGRGLGCADTVIVARSSSGSWIALYVSIHINMCVEERRGSFMLYTYVYIGGGGRAVSKLPIPCILWVLSLHICATGYYIVSQLACIFLHSLII